MAIGKRSAVALLACAASLHFAGCTTLTTQVMDVSLSGAQGASGKGVIRVSSDGVTSGSISTTGIEATQANIHAGSGAPIISLTQNGGGVWTVPDGAKVPPQSVGALYVSVDAKGSPGGALRGQLVPRTAPPNSRGTNG